MAGDELRVLVVDDHDLFRGGLIGLLEDRGIKIAGEASRGAQALALARTLDPDVVLMDVSMPGMSGIETTQRLTAEAAGRRVLILTGVADDRTVIGALLAGASGYLLKDAPIEHVVEGVRAAARGESAISPRVAAGLVRRLRQPAELKPALIGEQLTSREREILELLARGMDNPDIARSLFLSQHTVKNHVSSILVKLQVENRIQAAVRAVRAGLV